MPPPGRAIALAAILVLGAAACADTAVPPPPHRLASIPAGAVKVAPDADRFPPILHVDEWDDPIPLAGPINTAGAEDSPFITSDGMSLYFFFTPDTSLPAEEQLGDGVTGIWVSHREGDAWGEPTRVVLSQAGEAALDGCAFVDGDTIWFCSARAGNLRTIDIYTAHREDGVWTDWTNAGEVLNTDYLVGELHLSADGAQLFYHSDRPGGSGDIDIWITRLIDGAWQEPENVTAVNTPGPDGWPFLSRDGSELWITRVLDGSPALYRSIRDGDTWSTPVLVMSQFAGEAALDEAGNLYFTHHFYDGEAIEADIYVAYRR
jgi:hypothetical protein